MIEYVTRSSVIIMLFWLLSGCSGSSNREDAGFFEDAGGDTDESTFDGDGITENGDEEEPILTFRLFAKEPGSCFLYGRFLNPAFGEEKPREQVEELSNWRLEIDPDPMDLQPGSAVAYLKEPDGSRNVNLGFYLESCPKTPARGVLRFGAEDQWAVGVMEADEAIWTAYVQPHVLEGAGLDPAYLEGTYVSDIAECLLDFYRQKCQVDLRVQPVQKRNFPQDKDIFFYDPPSGNPLDPLVVSQSVQEMVANVPAGTIPFFLADNEQPEGDCFPNRACGYALYEVFAQVAEQTFHVFWASAEIHVRVDSDWSENDPSQWQSAPAADPDSLRLVSLIRRRFPVSLLHEIGHAMGLSHPTETIETRDDQGLNVMNRSGFFQGTEIEDLYQDSNRPEDFDLLECERLIQSVDLSTYQCLIIARNIPGY